jgi:hypothetical protein
MRESTLLNKMDTRLRGYDTAVCQLKFAKIESVLLTELCLISPIPKNQLRFAVGY